MIAVTAVDRDTTPEYKSVRWLHVITQQTRGIYPMLLQCWATVEDGGPTLKQHWMNAPHKTDTGIHPILFQCWAKVGQH